MDNQLSVHFKIGEIEFKAEGSPEDVERQREAFSQSLLPLAIDAMVRTRNVVVERQILQTDNAQALPEGIAAEAGPKSSLANVSINEFLNEKGFKTQIDLALGLIYYNEQMKGCSDFSTEDLKTYFKDAKITVPVNTSDVVNKLVGKSFIMNSDEKGRYRLTRSGDSFVNSFVCKEPTKGKPKARKARMKTVSSYSALNADNLNLSKYPEIKLLDSFKKQMLLTLYIVSEEGHGDTFSTADVQYFMIDILGIRATKDQINGVFQREKKWFTDIADNGNKKLVKHRLLTGAKDFAKEIVVAAQSANTQL